MFNPVSTYRIQFHKGYTFNDFERIIPYLHKLGVKTIYASPIFEASPGSTHGYDVVHPHRINPEIGNEEQLRNISRQLKDLGMSWVQDIVPNHMAFHPNNTWLMDVLEKGQRSPYASYFDIDWNSPVYKGRVMAPFLGGHLEETVKNKELSIHYTSGRFLLAYYETAYPLQLISYSRILQAGGSEQPQPIQHLLYQISQVQRVEDRTAYSSQWKEFSQQLESCMHQEDTRSYIERCLQEINNNTDLIFQIAEEQNYRLCHWQETDSRINYRRFFTINGLICLNIQHEEVFHDYHRLVKSFLEEDIFQGLRIDHIDGLYDPATYLERLRALAGEKVFITVEKILEPGEDLPKNWQIQGNTGYDFLSLVNNLFTQKKSESKFTSFYQSITGDKTAIHAQVREKKTGILYNHMAGELENLSRLFIDLKLAEEKVLSNLGTDKLRQVIGELLVECPVYRYYGNRFPLPGTEQKALQHIFGKIREEKEELSSALNVLEETLLKKPGEGNDDYNNRAMQFYMRCMQFSGPLMAKGVEDTLMYTYNRFTGHNEVGDSPESFGLSIEEFHERMIERQLHWPLSVNATATHDTKRGEDVRTRLNVLTDIPEEWVLKIKEWQQMHEMQRADGPDFNDEYLIYQTLVGGYPMPGQEDDNFSSRLQEYCSKALREAKLHSNWTRPNTNYEETTRKFAANLLDPDKSFWRSFRTLHQKVSDFGIVNSLGQTALKFTCPGVPDTYQGCELWDLSLVDPDNRRPVNYERRVEWLDKHTSGNPEEQEALIKTLWKNRYDGQIKLWLTHTLLNLRKEYESLFSEGHYIPLAAEGKYKDHVLAFARRQRETWLVVVLPLHLENISRQQKKPLDRLDWKDTHIVLPAEAPENFENPIMKSKGRLKKKLPVQDLFSTLPLAVLHLQQPVTDRGAGILMHITSLPAPFGIGDFGPEARKFADFLSQSRQKYWQILPLNPTEAGMGHSPYSSISSMAGNTILISPELLVKEGLLDKKDLKEYMLPVKETADYEEAGKIRNILFDKAFENFSKDQTSPLKSQFESFCRNEAYWLHDFALYVALKQEHSSAWFQWPEEYKLRRQDALDRFAGAHQKALDKIKWLQFLFTRQWQGLKTYCNNLGIKLIGDLPFYISYDSADVWANPGIFSLDEQGNPTGVAGVPPDYFNADGQLWGMPVFRWDVLKTRQYDWWVRRIRKNMELYDVLRLDHFRAFADYWEVPANEKSAKNGVWKPGPGSDFFDTLKRELGHLPFIAEDLGDINEGVHALRDNFRLPGMKVLQFAFGDDLPGSIYIPHNYTAEYVAYTGTHDNNTTVGWFRKDAGKTERKNVKRYTDIEVNQKNIHKVLGRLAYASVARTTILPVQDVLGLDESARMNTPASLDKNWLWRLKPEQLTGKDAKRLRKWVKLYNR